LSQLKVDWTMVWIWMGFVGLAQIVGELSRQRQMKHSNILIFKSFIKALFQHINFVRNKILDLKGLRGV
jgi:hypothetical protein